MDYRISDLFKQPFHFLYPVLVWATPQASILLQGLESCLEAIESFYRILLNLSKG